MVGRRRSVNPHSVCAAAGSSRDDLRRRDRDNPRSFIASCSPVAISSGGRRDLAVARASEDLADLCCRSPVVGCIASKRSPLTLNEVGVARVRARRYRSTRCIWRRLWASSNATSPTVRTQPFGKSSRVCATSKGTTKRRRNNAASLVKRRSDLRVYGAGYCTAAAQARIAASSPASVLLGAQQRR